MNPVDHTNLMVMGVEFMDHHRDSPVWAHHLAGDDTKINFSLCLVNSSEFKSFRQGPPMQGPMSEEVAIGEVKV